MNSFERVQNYFTSSTGNLVVFEVDAWTIERTMSTPNNVNIPKIKPHMIVKHACTHKVKGSTPTIPQVHVYPDLSGSCWRCEERIPESITALFILHEWGTI